MLAEMRQYVQLFEDRGFDRLVLSAKTSDALRTIEVNRRIAETFRYPIHLGLTHAGLPEDARTPSAVAGLGTLLAEGIGDTIRVSTARRPRHRDADGRGGYLIALGLRERRRPESVVCPACRAHRDRHGANWLAKSGRFCPEIEKPCRVAVMGCVVNGPGEAADADFAICAAKDKAYFYRNGQRIATVPEAQIIPRLLEALTEL